MTIIMSCLCCVLITKQALNKGFVFVPNLIIAGVCAHQLVKMLKLMLVKECIPGVTGRKRPRGM